MKESTTAIRRVHVSESGRVLTSDEAALLRKWLLDQGAEVACKRSDAPFLGIGTLPRSVS